MASHTVRCVVKADRTSVHQRIPSMGGGQTRRQSLETGRRQGYFEHRGWDLRVLYGEPRRSTAWRSRCNDCWRQPVLGNRRRQMATRKIFSGAFLKCLPTCSGCKAVIANSVNLLPRTG